MSSAFPSSCRLGLGRAFSTFELIGAGEKIASSIQSFALNHIPNPQESSDRRAECAGYHPVSPEGVETPSVRTIAHHEIGIWRYQ